jgi:hypothetical protein
VSNLYKCADPQARMLFSSRIKSGLVSGVLELDLSKRPREKQKRQAKTDTITRPSPLGEISENVLYSAISSLDLLCSFTFSPFTFLYSHSIYPSMTRTQIRASEIASRVNLTPKYLLHLALNVPGAFGILTFCSKVAWVDFYMR